MVVLAQIKLLFCLFVFACFFPFQVLFLYLLFIIFFSTWELVQLEWMDFM